MLFNLRALSPLVAFLATSALAQDHSSEQSEAQISDPNLECTPYYYAPSGQFVNTFPPIWQPATLLANDNRWPSLGQLNGSTINVTYDSVNDPDCWWSIRQCTTPKLAGLSPDVSSVPEPRTMGYGFDDGPNCTHNAFYNFLSSQNQKATMYYIGSNVLDWPLEAQRAVADGHEICALTAFQSQDAFAELWYTDRIRAIATALGLQTIVWKYDSFDWKAGQGNVTATDVDNNYNLFISNLTSGTFDTVGGIMLTHELNNFTMQQAIKWYPQLKAAFSAIVPIGVALNKTQPYKETNYSLPTFEQYVSGQVTASGSNSSGSGTGTGSGSSPTSSSSSGSGSTKSSSARTHVVHGAALWTVLCATALLAGLML
ncbi:chitin deacetylase [Lactarius hengduanensis]|nr:chitin deacetylase [Lactarius hengduanensis]